MELNSPQDRPIYVGNEIGRLRDVVVHRPGLEIARMTQHDFEQLLFDDILSPVEARREHDLMTDILRDAGAHVHELADILTRALTRAPVAERRALLRCMCALEGVVELTDWLLDWPSEKLAIALIAGLHWDEVPDAPASLARVRARIFEPFEMALRPLPNLMFMRDPCIAIGDLITVSNMARGARAREPALVRFALRWGLPSGLGPAITPLVAPGDVSAQRITIEGGDVLVLAPEWLLVGCSERTSAQGIERLAMSILFPNLPALQRVYAVLMPAQRSLMHLDTILTQVDTQLFLGHQPLISGAQGGWRRGRGHPKPLHVVRVTRDETPTLLERATVLDVLREELGAEVELVPCGGEDPVQQEREQWTDGANAVCVTPGHVVLYSRNTRTIDALRQRGFESCRLSVVQSRAKRATLVAEGMARPRTVFCFAGSELSRARGGGRCLTMPLRREVVPAR